jgi:hypothetical protein
VLNRRSLLVPRYIQKMCVDFILKKIGACIHTLELSYNVFSHFMLSFGDPKAAVCKC